MPRRRRRDNKRCRPTKGSCENILLVQFDVMYDIDVEIDEDSVEIEVLDVDDIDDII